MIDETKGEMARPERFELPTKWFEATYSIQLSYGRAGAAVYRKVSLAAIPSAGYSSFTSNYYGNRV